MIIIENIKEVLVAFLNRPIVVYDKFNIASHPFTNFATLAFDDTETHERIMGDVFADAKENGKAIDIGNGQHLIASSPLADRWRASRKAEIDRLDNLDDIFLYIKSIMNKPYRLECAYELSQYISSEDFSCLLRDTWIEVENASYGNGLTKKQIKKMFEKAIPNILMSKKDYELYLAFPSEIEIYRGVSRNSTENIKAFSWTTDKEKATWFANRFSHSTHGGYVYKAKIRKEHIYAYFTARNESEVVVDPTFLENIRLVETVGVA